MYYRVATQVDATATWQRKSTVLSSLQSLFQFLKPYGARQFDHLWVFSSSSREGLAEQLEQENQGLATHAVMAADFLRERLISPAQEVRTRAEHEVGTNLEMIPSSIGT